MKDQAESLRLRLQKQADRAKTKALAVVSGKGGVGKSNFSLNFSISLSKRGYTVLLFDMDIGMGNIDILMGRSAEYSIVDHLKRNIPLKEVILEGPNNIHYIAGGTGLTELVSLDDKQVETFTEELQNVLLDYDYIIFDMGAGLSDQTVRFLLSVDEILVIMTPEPTSLTDAYATMKYLYLLNSAMPYYLVVNRAHSEKEGMETLKKMKDVLSRFIGKESIALGMLPDDRTVQQAVIRQIPFVNYNGKAPAAKAMEEIVNRYEKQRFTEVPSSKSFHFVSRLKQFLFER